MESCNAPRRFSRRFMARTSAVSGKALMKRSMIWFFTSVLTLPCSKMFRAPFMKEPSGALAYICDCGAPCRRETMP